VRVRRRLASCAIAQLLAVGCGDLKSAADDAGAVGATADGAADDGGSAGAASVPDPGPCDGPCPVEPLVTGLDTASVVTVDDANVYFAEHGPAAGRVSMCRKTGCNGSPTMLGDGYTFGIAVVGGTVYWGDNANGRILSCPVTGCASAPAVVAQDQPKARGVWTDGTRLFWTTPEAGGSIIECAPGACSPAPVRTGVGDIFHLAAEQSRLVWIAGGATQTCLWTACASPTILGSGSVHPSIRDGIAYWVSGASETVVKCATSGCNAQPLAVGGSTLVQWPRSDGTSVFWRDGSLDEIYRCRVSGCPPRQR
jgi:hypothetical protein